MSHTSAYRKSKMSNIVANGSRGDGGLADRYDLQARDRRFIHAMALAFQRGDHLPKGSSKLLLLVG